MNLAITDVRGLTKLTLEADFCYSTSGAVVRLVKEHLGVLTLAIGDGANDVAMIHLADVGVGISGKQNLYSISW